MNSNNDNTNHPSGRRTLPRTGFSGGSNTSVGGRPRSPQSGRPNVVHPTLRGRSTTSPLPQPRPSTQETVLRVQGVHKSYSQGSGQLHILKGIDLVVKKNEALCIVGSSGAGKSTLLHILGTLDRPDRGHVFFKAKNLFGLDDEALAQFRNQSLGFVFQFHHLMAEFTALENVMMPARLGGDPVLKAKEKALTLLERVGLGSRMQHYPNELSGGELQRVAIARSLVNNPEILFVDEPTGNLDSKNAMQIQDLFFDLISKSQTTLIAVTHDPRFASRFSRVLKMQDGQWARGDAG